MLSLLSMQSRRSSSHRRGDDRVAVQQYDVVGAAGGEAPVCGAGVTERSVGLDQLYVRVGVRGELAKPRRRFGVGAVVDDDQMEVDSASCQYGSKALAHILDGVVYAHHHGPPNRGTPQLAAGGWSTGVVRLRADGCRPRAVTWGVDLPPVPRRGRGRSGSTARGSSFGGAWGSRASLWSTTGTGGRSSDSAPLSLRYSATKADMASTAVSGRPLPSSRRGSESRKSPSRQRREACSDSTMARELVGECPESCDLRLVFSQLGAALEEHPGQGKSPSGVCADRIVGHARLVAGKPEVEELVLFLGHLSRCPPGGVACGDGLLQAGADRVASARDEVPRIPSQQGAAKPPPARVQTRFDAVL